MFADDKSIENFQQLFFEFKKYLELQKEYTKLELTEKLTILFSTLIMVLVLIILGMVALFYLLFALAYVLEPLVGGLMASFAIIAGINVLLIIHPMHQSHEINIIWPVLHVMLKKPRYDIIPGQPLTSIWTEPLIQSVPGILTGIIR